MPCKFRIRSKLDSWLVRVCNIVKKHTNEGIRSSFDKNTVISRWSCNTNSPIASCCSWWDPNRQERSIRLISIIIVFYCGSSILLSKYPNESQLMVLAWFGHCDLQRVITENVHVVVIPSVEWNCAGSEHSRCNRQVLCNKIFIVKYRKKILRWNLRTTAAIIGDVWRLANTLEIIATDTMSRTVTRTITFKRSCDSVTYGRPETVDAIVPRAREDVCTSFDQQLLVIVESSCRRLDVVVEWWKSAKLCVDPIIW